MDMATFIVDALAIMGVALAVFLCRVFETAIRL